MAWQGLRDWRTRTNLAAGAVACLGCSLASVALAGMTPAQMKSLGGASLLHGTAKQLLERCGLPASIADKAEAGAPRRKVSWRGVAMRLSAADWQLSYGTLSRGATNPEPGWRNPEPSREACAPGVAWMAFHARGGSGVVTVRKRPDGSGYDTTYRVPDNLFEAHQVIGVRAALSGPIPMSTLVARYGAPDEVVTSPAGRKRHRYWVLTRNDQRPDSLHAVEFETEAGEESSAGYGISATGTDFVDARMARLLREWERDHVLD